MDKKIIDKLSQLIKEYINNGGSIYVPRRKNPTYNTIRYYLGKYKAEGHPNATIADMYKLCGYDYDKEYARYLELIERLTPFADEENYVDGAKKSTGSGGAKSLLTDMSSQLGCSPSDYLVLMTDFRYRKAIIQTNYVANLKKELQKNYPDGDVSNIRRDNPSLYYKLNHFYKYSPVPISMQDIAELFNIFNDRFLNTTYEDKIDEEAIIKELLSKYEGKDISNLAKNDSTLYFKVVKCAIIHNQTIGQWLSQFQFKNMHTISIDRFSHTIVDASKREQELKVAIQDVVNEHTFESPKTDAQRYHQRKQIAKLALEKVNSKDSELTIFD